MFHISHRLIKREHKTALAYLNSKCDGMYHANMEEARKEYYRTVMVLLKGEVSASRRLEAINILAVQNFCYYAQKNDCG